MNKEGTNDKKESAADAARPVFDFAPPPKPVKTPARSKAGDLDKKLAAARARAEARAADPIQARGDRGFETRSGATVSFEEAFWELEAAAQAKGVTASLMGSLLAKSETPADAFDALELALTKRNPRSYVAGIIRSLGAEAAPPGPPGSARLPGDPDVVPQWVLDARRDGETVSRDGKSWLWDGGYFDDAGNEIGF